MSFVRYLLNGEEEAIDEVYIDLEACYEGVQAAYFAFESSIKAATITADELTERRLASLRQACANYLDACIVKSIFYVRANKPVKAALMVRLCWKLY